MPVAIDSEDAFLSSPDPLLESNKPSLSALAEQRLPIVIPWHPEQVIYPGQLFHSRLSRTQNPWSKISPFIDTEQEQETGRVPRRMVYLSADGGTSGSFKSTKSQSTTAKEDHESYGFTATVDLGFCSASGSLQYDRHLSTNNDDVMTSVRSSYRCGSVLLRQAPELTTEAQIELKYGDGLEGFEDRFGDYYLFGYNIGGDNTMMVSTNSQSMSLAERRTLSVKIESFFFDIEFTTHFDSAEASASASLRVTGYDSLLHTVIDQSQSWAASATADFDRMQRDTAKMRNLGSTLPTRVEKKAEEVGLLLSPTAVFGDRAVKINNSPYTPIAALERDVDESLCERLVKSGLVVEMVLIPVRSLRSVQYWITEDDII
ncbi:hypothetical protein A4X13_0g4961 [Tilletia indica]|uniref:Uncharacterized protein n=1 Tax=Tilletia indica TaxID=43049 RepID=A0A177TV43_9BASI|nr:hypothetical protein A4X13_0g4961 [Tilletia indica]